MTENKHFTYYLVLLHLLLIPLVYFKTYIGPIPLSIEVVLIPLLVLAFLYDYKIGRITFSTINIWPFVIAFAIYFMITVISLTKAVNLTSGLMEIARYLSYVFLFLIVLKVKFTQKQYYHFAITFGISVVLVGLYGLAQYVFNINLNTAGMFALQEAKGRVYSTFINPNYYSAFVNFVIPTLLLLSIIYFKNKKAQLFVFAIFAIYVMNMVLTYTRAAWVIMAGAFVLTALLTFKPFMKNIFKPHMIVAFLLLGTFVYHMPDFQSRTSSAIYAAESLLFGNRAATPADEVEEGDPEEFIDEDGDGIPDVIIDEPERPTDPATERAVVSRMALWKTGYYMFKENPVLGVGVGNYGDRYKEFVTKYPELYLGHERYSVHNSFLKIMAETGAIGILSFISIYIVACVYLVKLYIRQHNKLAQLLVVGLFVGALTYLMQNMSNNLIFIPQINIVFWLLSAVVIGYAHTYRETKETYM